jgi:hypothetical protein
MPLGTRKFLAGKGSGATDDECIIRYTMSASSGVNFMRDASIMQDPAGYVLNIRNWPDEFTDPNYPAVVILRPGISYNIKWKGVGTADSDCLRSGLDATNLNFVPKGRYTISFGQGRDANGYTTAIWTDYIEDTVPDRLNELQFKFTETTFPVEAETAFTVTSQMVNNNQGIYGNYTIDTGGTSNGGTFDISIRESIV